MRAVNVKEPFIIGVLVILLLFAFNRLVFSKISEEKVISQMEL